MMDSRIDRGPDSGHRGQHRGTRADPQPGALPRINRPTARDDLKGLTLAALSTELLARLASGETYRDTESLLLAEQIRQVLEARIDVHLNRFAPRRYHDLLQPVLEWIDPADLKGATVVDVGCGSVNPFMFSFLLLMLGAERAYAVDLEPIQDQEMSIRALATAASWLLLDPGRIVDAGLISAKDVLENLEGFRLPLLAAGDPAGIAASRLLHLTESVNDLSLRDGEADAVFSVSVLEHLGDLAKTLESLRRITRSGGLGIHVVDFSDHRIYTGAVESPFEFLKIDSPEPLVHGSNRIRCDEMCRLFERHGFIVERVEQWSHALPLTDEEQAQFAESYRSLRRENLTAIGARLFVRRAGTE